MNRFLCLSLLLLSACATQPTPENTDRYQPLEGERLLAVVPDNWRRISQINSDKTRLSDFIPQGDTAENWSTKLSFESFSTVDISGDPINLLMSEAQADKSSCNFVQHFNIHSGYENNYETSVRLFLCGENAFSSKGEVKLMKVILGEQYLYSIRIVRRIEPFDVSQPELTRRVVANWSSFLSSISLCDDTPSHPCPAPTQSH